MPEIMKSHRNAGFHAGNGSRPIRVLLAYPNTTSVALSNLGFQRVYSLLNRIEGVVCDRYSLPAGWTPDVLHLERNDLRSHDSGRLPEEFDILAFSISFEPDYLNAAAMLRYFNIPLERSLRGRGYPLVAAGGSAIFINPEPLGDVCDLFFIGEAEELAEKFFSLCRNGDWDDPRDLLPQAAGIAGVYVPQFYSPEYERDTQVALRAGANVPKRVVRHWVGIDAPSLAKSPQPPFDKGGTFSALRGGGNEVPAIAERHRRAAPVASGKPAPDEVAAHSAAVLCTHSEIHEKGSAFKNMALMEATRGCIWACRFCTAGFIYRPPRLPDLEKTYDSLSKVLREQGDPVSVIGLVGPSVTDHPGLLSTARRIVAEGKTLSFSSLRMETLNDEWVDLMVRSGQKTVTVAIDGPSERMRDVINKSATDEFIVEKCRFLTGKGLLHLKIYSIIGLPGETEDDIDQFIRLAREISRVYVEACSERGNIGRLTFGLSPLVPKPGTPFQWHPMERVEVLKKRFMKIRKALGRAKHVKLSFGSPNEAYLQTFLSRGDRSLLGFFREYLANGHDAKRALKDGGVAPDAFVYRQYGRDDFLPWDIVDHGYRNHFLWQDYQRGLREKTTPICDTAVCKICGVC